MTPILPLIPQISILFFWDKNHIPFISKYILRHKQTLKKKKKKEFSQFDMIY